MFIPFSDSLNEDAVSTGTQPADIVIHDSQRGNAKYTLSQGNDYYF